MSIHNLSILLMLPGTFFMLATLIMSLKMQNVYETIERISPSSLFVLVQGESGTGKELVARVIHKKSSRKDGPFVPVNCGSVNDGVTEGKLYDHVVGLFEASEGGTIYLDEITELAPSLQAKFLQVFEEIVQGSS